MRLTVTYIVVQKHVCDFMAQQERQPMRPRFEEVLGDKNGAIL